VKADRHDGPSYSNPLDSVSGPTTQWTRNNVGEAFPGVVTPLHHDFVVRAGELGIRGAYAERGAITEAEAQESDVADERVMAAFSGRLAVNVDTMCAFGDRVSATAAMEIEYGLLGFVREDVVRNPTTDRHAIIAERDAALRTSIEARALDRYREAEEFWRASTAPAVLDDVAGAPDRWRAAWDHFLEAAIVMTHVTTYAGEAFVALLTACDRAGRPELLARLNGGYGDTHDDEMSAAMWALAHGGLTMEEFLAEYGYQGNRAADLYATVWREDPELLRPLLDAMASMTEADGPEASGRVRADDRAAAELELLGALSGDARDAAMKAIADARHYTVLREQVKVISQRSLDVARAAARTLGRDLMSRGLLADPEDVFHLLAEEFVIEPAADLGARVSYRKGLAAEYATFELPVLFVGNPEPLPVTTTDAPRPEARTLTGLGVSPGVVEGRARVVLDPATSEPLEPGEILVCAATDPSWVGHFLVAAALVIDVGGPMSHGAIVARELGVPCVINTVEGTSRLCTGDTVRIDGAAGTVEVLARA
jgi:phosphohistidine swiveling domain-containing protein